MKYCKTKISKLNWTLLCQKTEESLSAIRIVVVVAPTSNPAKTQEVEEEAFLSYSTTSVCSSYSHSPKKLYQGNESLGKKEEKER